MEQTLVVALSSPRIRGEMSYPLEFSPDGRQIPDEYVQVALNAEPYGNTEIFEELRAQNRSLFTDPDFGMAKVSSDAQYLSGYLTHVIPRWNSNFSYDPEITMTLLFDPSETENYTAPDERQRLDSALPAVAIGVIAAAVVVVVLGASVAVLIKIIFPYYAARKKTQAAGVDLSEPIVGTEHQNGREANPKWAAADRPKSLQPDKLAS